MNKSLKLTIEELMKELSADSYKRSYDWNGYEVYEPIYKKEIEIGPPLVVFVKDGIAKISSPKESFEYLKFWQKKNARNKFEE